MSTRKFTLKIGAAALTYATLALAGNPALAVEYWLKAGATTVNLPGAPAPVAMWGYALCGTGSATPAGWPASCSGAVSVPGPSLMVPVGDASLTVHLANGLMVPTSLVINGLIKPMAPVWAEPGSTTPLSSRGTSTTARVRSFDTEAAADGTAVYTWTNVNPGTYLYQSGTQVQVQVQMGLYGAVTKNVTNAAAATATAPAVRGQAYTGLGYEFDNEATLLYSEIDPDLHAAVASGAYGTTGPTSTIDYTPRYFLINGAPYAFGASAIEPVGIPGITLLRLLNAGLTTHVPMIQGMHWDVIAEDGKPYTWRRTQYTALLPAAKTVDVLFTPEIGATYSIMDRRLSLSNNGMADGGMQAFLRVSMLGGGAGGGSTPVPPKANSDGYDSVPGVTLNVAAAGVLVNDDAGDSPIFKAVAATGATSGGGTYTLNANGSFTYTPKAGYAGATDTFTYNATDGKALSNVGTVTINLKAPPIPTLGGLDSFARPTDPATANSLGADWYQQVATTGTSVPDIGTSGSGTAVANATALGGLAIWKASFGTKQGASATLPANAYLVLKASGPDLQAPVNYVRVGCEGGQVVVSTMMGGSNTSAFVKQAAFGVCVGTVTLSAVVDNKGLVTVFRPGAAPEYVGGVQLPDVAAWKGPGRIGIQLRAVGATAGAFAGGTL